MSPDSYAAIRGKSVIDLVRDDLDTLPRIDMSRVDRMKLEAWKALLSDTGMVISAGQCTQDLAATLGVTQTNVSKAGMRSLGTDILTTKVTDSLDGADEYSVLAQEFESKTPRSNRACGWSP